MAKRKSVPDNWSTINFIALTFVTQRGRSIATRRPIVVPAEESQSASATNSRATHFSWLCHLTHERPAVAYVLVHGRERLCNRVISARDAELESKSLSLSLSLSLSSLRPRSPPSPLPFRPSPSCTGPIGPLVYSRNHLRRGTVSFKTIARSDRHFLRVG